MDKQVLLEAISEIRDCTLIMFANACFIQRELQNVDMRDESRVNTVKICETMIGTKIDVISDIDSIDQILESDSKYIAVSSIINRVMGWLWDDISKMHELVMALRKDSDENKKYSLSLILVQESATNIRFAFNRAKAAVDVMTNENRKA